MSPRAGDRRCVTSPDLHTPAVNNSSAHPAARCFSRKHRGFMVNDELMHALNVFTHQVMSRQRWCNVQLLRNRVVCDSSEFCRI